MAKTPRLLKRDCTPEEWEAELARRAAASAAWAERRRRNALDRHIREIRERANEAVRASATAHADLSMDGVEKQFAAAVVEEQMAGDRLTMLARWSHKNEGTPETHERASRVNQGALARLYENGKISSDQLAWAVEIATVAEGIERDVSVRSASLEARVDNAGSGRNVLVEGVMRVRREIAYTRWRSRLPMPRRAVLDMIVGEPVPFSTIARRYRIHKRRALHLLTTALDEWDSIMREVEDEVDAATVAAAHAGLI